MTSASPVENATVVPPAPAVDSASAAKIKNWIAAG